MRSNFTPKDRFLKGQYAEEQLKWSRSEVSRAAIEAALSYMAATRKGANLILLEGAADFADILLNLAEPAEKTEREDRRTLYSEPPPKPK